MSAVKSRFNHWPKRRLSFEQLGARRMLASSVLDLEAGVLRFTDFSNPGIDNNLFISRTSAGYEIEDLSGATISASSIVGALGSDTPNVTIPSSISVSKLVIYTGGGNDQLAFDMSSSSNPFPAEPIIAAFGSGHDTMTLANNGTNNRWNIREDNRGEVIVDDFGTILLSGVQDWVGGAGDDIFDVLNPTATGNKLDGGAGGKDRFVTKYDGSFTLTDSSVSIFTPTSNRSFAIAGMEIANLIGGHGNNLMNALAYSGQAILDGGKGNDHLRGGSGNDFLLGREGDDVLVGNGGDDRLYGDVGRDILSGGEGQDTQNGGVGEDILLGGRYELDNTKAALDTIMGAWRDARNYSTRLTILRDTGVGLSSQFKFSIETVLDDEKADALIGGSDLDWFLAQNSSAELGFENPTRTSSEILTKLTPRRLRRL
jgi:Ca2+-binding RTX toxin-like protein